MGKQIKRKLGDKIEAKVPDVEGKAEELPARTYRVNPDGSLGERIDQEPVEETEEED